MGVLNAVPAWMSWIGWAGAILIAAGLILGLHDIGQRRPSRVADAGWFLGVAGGVALSTFIGALTVMFLAQGVSRVLESRATPDAERADSADAQR
jgi:hypothetical protein